MTRTLQLRAWQRRTDCGDKEISFILLPAGVEADHAAYEAVNIEIVPHAEPVPPAATTASVRVRRLRGKMTGAIYEVVGAEAWIIEGEKRTAIANSPYWDNRDCYEELPAQPAVAEQQHGPCTECGYDAWSISVESGEKTCRVCDLAGRARDAEAMEKEFQQQLAKAQADAKSLRTIILMWCDLQDGTNPIEAICNIERVVMESVQPGDGSQGGSQAQAMPNMRLA